MPLIQLFLILQITSDFLLGFMDFTSIIDAKGFAKPTEWLEAEFLKTLQFSYS